MKINAGQIKQGDCIRHNGEIFQVVKTEHNYRGRGSAWLKIKLKNTESGRVLEETFSPDGKIEKLDVDSIKLQFLYRESQELQFMNPKTYDQVAIPIKIVGNLISFLKEGQDLFVLMYDGRPLAVTPPNKVILKVTESDTAVKGDTASTARKIVTVETGAKIQVPLFVKTGDKIVVSPETGDYLERTS